MKKLSVLIVFLFVFFLLAKGVEALTVDRYGNVLFQNSQVLNVSFLGPPVPVGDDVMPTLEPSPTPGFFDSESVDSEEGTQDPPEYIDDSDESETEPAETIEPKSYSPKPMPVPSEEQLKKIKLRKLEEARAKKELKNRLEIKNKNKKTVITNIKENPPLTLPEVEEEEVELQEGEEIEIEESTQSANVKVKTKNEHYYIAKAKIAARTKFPLSVDLNTNELIVTTPSGEKRVTVLPDAAVQNMISRDILDVVNGLNTSDPEYTNEFEMEQKDDGTLVYKIEGAKNKKFLGFYAVEVPKEVEVSTETGEVVDVNQSIGDALLDAFSF